MIKTSGGSRGLWNNPRPVQCSKELQDLMRLRKEESRLTCSQTKQISRNLKTSCQTSDPSAFSSSSQSIPVSLPAKTQRRSAESCRSGNSYEREMFCPGPSRDLEKEKRRLQNIMATGKESPEPLKPEKKPAGCEAEASEEIDRYQEVLNEIEERQQFLANMAALGQERQYIHIINREISQNIRELELLDPTSRHKKQ